MTENIVQFRQKAKKPQSDHKLPPPSETDLIGFVNTLHFLVHQGASESTTVDMSLEQITITVRQYFDVEEEDEDNSSGSCLEFIASNHFDTEIDSMNKLTEILRNLFKKLDIDYYAKNNPDEQT